LIGSAVFAQFTAETFGRFFLKVPIFYSGHSPFSSKLAPSHWGIWTPIELMIPWASPNRQ